MVCSRTSLVSQTLVRLSWRSSTLQVENQTQCRASCCFTVVGDGGLCDLGFNARYACDETSCVRTWISKMTSRPLPGHCLRVSSRLGGQRPECAVDRWVEGNLAEGELGEHGGGSCSGSDTGQNDLYSFTAMEAGTYVLHQRGCRGYHLVDPGSVWPRRHRDRL